MNSGTSSDLTARSPVRNGKRRPSRRASTTTRGTALVARSSKLSFRLPDWLIAAVATEKAEGFYSVRTEAAAIDVTNEIDAIIERRDYRTIRSLLRLARPNDFTRFIAQTVWLATAPVREGLKGEHRRFEIRVVHPLEKGEAVAGPQHG